jgi:chromate transport protein ChrA
MLNWGHTTEVLAFLKLGVTSLGGPFAHIGYFRREFVERKDWVTAMHRERVALTRRRRV